MAATLIAFSEQERLKEDLQTLRHKGTLKCTQSGRSCTRCRAELGRIINRGAFCPACRHRVCKNCREYTSNQATEWLCTVCHKHMELTAASGDWIDDFSHRQSKRRDNLIRSAATVKHSIQRSWTFSDASPSPWSALRGSPELRAYSSMPRHQDCDFIPRTAFTNRTNYTHKNTTTTVNNSLGDNKTESEIKYKLTDSLINPPDRFNDEPVIIFNDENKNETEIEDLIGKEIIVNNLTSDEKTSDSEPSIIEEHSTTIPVTDNDSSIGSPLIDKRTYSESTSIDNQSSIGSPDTGKRFCNSPLTDSPMVAKRNINEEVVEPLTGSVFRKVTFRKRRVDTKNLPPGVTPPRSRRNPRTRTNQPHFYHEDIAEYNPRFLFPDVEDYRLVFISSSDSSSREELQSDECDVLPSSQLDDCDWDYFEATASGGDLLPGGVVVAHRASQPSAVQQSTACVPVPIPVPIPVPFPVLVPIPWHPDLTIRIEHSLAPLWTNLISQQLITVTANRSIDDGEPAMTEQVDDSQENVCEANPGDGCDDTDSSTTSEESGHQKHKSTRRIYRFNREELDSEDEQSSGEFSMGTSPPSSLSSDEHFKKTFVVNDSDSDIGELPEYNEFEQVGVVTLLKHVQIDVENNSSREQEPDVDENGSAGFIDLKSVLSDVIGGNTGFKESESVNLEPSEMLRENTSDSSLPVIDLKLILCNESGGELIPDNTQVVACENGADDSTVNNQISFGQDDRVDNKVASGNSALSTELTEDVLGCKSDVIGLSLCSDALSESKEDKTLVEACDNKHTDIVLSELDVDTAVSLRNQTNQFLTKEIEYLHNMGEINSDFILADNDCDKKLIDISDEESGKTSETRGSNTSDEFSGTESMELEQGQIRSGGPVTCSGQAASAVRGESCRETGRFTSLVMITQEHLSSADVVNVVPSDTTVIVPFPDSGQVRVVTGKETLSAVVCLEEGLADDDSWVEELDREDFVTTTEESSEGEEATFPDREEELRGYHRAAIDFTLHTIVEESCEESEVETEKNKQTELEKYFFYGLGDGMNDSRETDTMSETSSIYSEGLESLGGNEHDADIGTDPADLASSRLEKYFLSGFMGFNRRDSDGSVGSDSEGRPSPEQRRKRLVRARGTGRQHSSSLDNLTESEQQDELQIESEGSSTETDSHDEQSNSFEKNDGQFDTVKRTKKKKRSVVTAPSLELLEDKDSVPSGGKEEDSDAEDGNKTPQPPAELGSIRNKQHSRDSGFMGSCDDLLKETRESPVVEGPSLQEENVQQIQNKIEEKVLPQVSVSSPPATGLTRKDSFNNWSSDEETNLMMSKMRAFFKTMVGTQPKPSSPNVRMRSKPPQLLYFESELTRLMKTVPGIRDDQVREIVEYLSSEDTWSDSYDSSDYTSSDLEGGNKKSALQEEISASCRQIISNFETTEDAMCSTPTDALNKDTAFVYQRLVASFSKMEAPSSDSSTSHSSPPLIAKVMQHIGSRLVALMHEVSGGEGGSPKASRYHRRLQPKLSTSTTEDEEDLIEDYSPLPRSKSHDPLIEENRQEASDNERFSWRGSFESALMASDSRTRLASGGEGSVSASALALAAKRRSAGDLLFKSCSREQLDRVRSCGSIGGSVEDKIWGSRQPKRRRSSVPDSGGSNDGDDDSDDGSARCTTLPRSLQNSCVATNSLPRLPTSPTSASPSIYKANSVHLFNVKSARYRPPGYNCRTSSVAIPPPRRDAARRRTAHTPPPSNITSSTPSVVSDDVSLCSEPSSTLEEDAAGRLISSHRTSLGARSDSLASVYSGAGEGRYGSVAVKGEVEFGLQYNYKQGALEILVKQCRDLAAVDTKRNRSDPYVKVYLLPDKSKSGKRKTRVKKHTLNPIFDETLKFHITLEGLESRTLWLSVWHSDMFGRNDFLGEITMPLENKIFDDPLPKFYTLQERSEPLDELLNNKGELIVGLKFVPPSENISSNKKRNPKGFLQVLVKEAKNLSAVKNNGTSDPFCKSYLLPDKGRSSKQKTPVLRRSCSPAWNHTFTYHGVTLEELSERSIELTIWDHDRLASNEFLGGVRLNLGSGKHNGKPVDWMDSSGKETTLWQRMLERPNLWVESCLTLRPTLDVRNSS